MNTSSIAPLAITVGEPAGIGPEIAIRAALASKVPCVLLGDRLHLQRTAAQMNADISFLTIEHVPLSEPVVAGQLNRANAPQVLQLLDSALDGIAQGRFSAMVTAPVQKSIICEAGFAFTGHTEYLADKTRTERVVMMLAGGNMRVALATTHLALSQVPAAITRESLTRTLQIMLHDLQHKFGIAAPRILVTGLNPHAGENGHMGREEIDTIAPVIHELQRQGHAVSGPYPADTLFQPRYLDNADAVLAMFHDQGLPVLKYASFGHGINITLGLPIIRTSVDHGTALDLAGRNVADAGSMMAAISCAHDMVVAQQRTL
ncbi:MAG: 4-hydroxythreonine-4-phosphate dehydrogenase PdxA [Formosimonas sp.]